MCGSAKLGDTYLFFTSITFVVGPFACDAFGPTYAILSFFIAIWIFS